MSSEDRSLIEADAAASVEQPVDPAMTSHSEPVERGPRIGRLEPVVIRVPTRKIRDSWPILSVTSQDQVLKIMENAAHEVLASVSDTAERAQLNKYLTRLVAKIARRLSKSPVPRGTKDVAFDYEAITQHNRVLEQVTVPLLAQIDDLERAVAVEKHRLAQDKRYLTMLRREREKKQRQRRIASSSELTRLIDSVPLSHVKDMPEDIGWKQEMHNTYDLRLDLDMMAVLNKLLRVAGKLRQKTAGVDSVMVR